MRVFVQPSMRVHLYLVWVVLHQIKAMKKVAGTLRIDLASYRELEAFTKFGSDLDAATQAKLNRGRRTVEVLKQPVHEPLPC